MTTTCAVAACAAQIGCEKTDLSNPVAPSVDDVASDDETPNPVLAGHQSAEAVLADAHGITVLCRANPSGTGEHTWLIQLADDGSVRWQKHYSPSQGIGRAIAAVPGGFVIAGEVQRGAMAYQGSILRVDNRGAVLSASAFGAPGVTGFSSLAMLGDGTALAGGSTDGKGWLVHTDRALHTSWDQSLADLDEIVDLAAVGNGFAMAAVREKASIGFGLGRVSAFDGDRRMRWQDELPAHGRGEPAALASLGDGGLIMVGHRAASKDDDGSQLWIARLSAGGQLVWERTRGSSSELRHGTAVVALADGAAVAGSVLRHDRRALDVAKFAADGSLVWDHEYGGERDDSAEGIAATADGGLVLVGSTMSKGPGKTNVWVLRLDPNGRMIWEKVFGSAG